MRLLVCSHAGRPLAEQTLGPDKLAQLEEAIQGQVSGRRGAATLFAVGGRVGITRCAAGTGSALALNGPVRARLPAQGAPARPHPRKRLGQRRRRPSPSSEDDEDDEEEDGEEEEEAAEGGEDEEEEEDLQSSDSEPEEEAPLRPLASNGTPRVSRYANVYYKSRTRRWYGQLSHQNQRLTTPSYCNEADAARAVDR